jgi:hypothetical protein
MWKVLSGDVEGFIGGCGGLCSKAESYIWQGFDANF